MLKVAATANVTTWDPIKSFSTEALYMGNVYEQLLRINPPGAKERFTPLLAESWESSADGLSWTFKLRPDVKFHDGEPLERFCQSLRIARGNERERRMSEKKGVIIIKEVYVYPGKVANRDIRLSHEHTEYVCKEFLGMGDEEFVDYMISGAFGF